MRKSIQVTILKCKNGYYVRIDLNDREERMVDFICPDESDVAKLVQQTLWDMDQEDKQGELF